MAQITLSARIRENRGKGAARELRRNDKIPAVFYGPGLQPIMLAVGYSDLERIIKGAASENIILELQIESGSGIDTRTVMLKELQIDPINDSFLHADFYKVSKDKEITVDVPIHLINTPAGVIAGGVLQFIRRELAISCLPDKLVDSFDIDVSGLDIGDSIHIHDMELPEGIRPLDEEHLTIAVVTAPTVVAEEAMEEVEEEAVQEEKTDAEAESSEES